MIDAPPPSTHCSISPRYAAIAGHCYAEYYLLSSAVARFIRLLAASRSLQRQSELLHIFTIIRFARCLFTLCIFFRRISPSRYFLFLSLCQPLEISAVLPLFARRHAAVAAVIALRQTAAATARATMDTMEYATAIPTPGQPRQPRQSRRNI